VVSSTEQAAISSIPKTTGAVFAVLIKQFIDTGMPGLEFVCVMQVTEADCYRKSGSCQ
jgi:hypothetical protein